MSRPTPATAPEAAEAAEVARRINDAIRALPAGQRQAAGAYHLSGLTQAEAAAHLGIPAGAIKTRLHKGAQRASPLDYRPERPMPMTTSTPLVAVSINGVFQPRASDSAVPIKTRCVIVNCIIDSRPHFPFAGRAWLSDGRLRQDGHLGTWPPGCPLIREHGIRPAALPGLSRARAVALRNLST